MINIFQNDQHMLPRSEYEIITFQYGKLMKSRA